MSQNEDLRKLFSRLEGESIERINKMLAERGVLTRMDPITRKTYYEYSSLSAHEILDHLARDLQIPEARLSARAALLERLQNGAETLTENDVVPYREQWINHGGGEYSNGQSRREAEAVLTAINTLPLATLIPHPAVPAQPLPADIATINRLETHWEAVRNSPFAISTTKENAEAALQFLAAQRPKPPTSTS